MELRPGTQLGPYEILAEIGAGGMGQIYKARDTRLGRYVAIKVLPPNMLGDEERKQRFFREAKAASALNHPNIVTIHNVGSEEGVEFMVMEYVAGRSLEELIPKDGLKLALVLKYSLQIAEALAKAHQAGIVHRDLKPANVMVTPDGLVKVLDFGLAKLTGLSAEEADSEETRTAVPTGPLTVEGSVLGTVNYMSPEQAEGKAVDTRSDIFSFGVLLYEMLTGRRAFGGETMLGTLSSILRDEPQPPSRVVGDVPRDLERLIQRCLRKEPNRRAQSMADVKVALEELKEESDSGSVVMTGSISGPPAREPVPPSEAPSRRRGPVWVWAVLAVSAIALGAAGFLWWSSQRQPAGIEADVARLQEEVEKAQELAQEMQRRGEMRGARARGGPAVKPPVPAAGNVPEVREPLPPKPSAESGFKPGPKVKPGPEPPPRRGPLSRGGMRGLAGALGGNTGLWLLSADPDRDEAPRAIDTGLAPAFEPRFSPSGNRIAFGALSTGEPGIWVTDTEGTAPRRLTRMPGMGARWSPDGRQIVFVSGREQNTDIFVADVSGGRPTRLTREPSMDRSPTWSRDGKSIYFGSDRSGEFQVWKMPSTGGAAVQVTKNGGAEAFDAPDGRVTLYVKPRPETGIWAVVPNSVQDRQVSRGGIEGGWRVTRDGIYFLGRMNTPRPALFFIRGLRWQPVTILEFEGRLPRRRPSFDISSDGRWVVAAMYDVPPAAGP